MIGAIAGDIVGSVYEARPICAKLWMNSASNIARGSGECLSIVQKEPRRAGNRRKRLNQLLVSGH